MGLFRASEDTHYKVIFASVVAIPVFALALTDPSRLSSYSLAALGVLLAVLAKGLLELNLPHFLAALVGQMVL